ncbi:hypothetical protein PRN20_08450 [Devosia sp. ZB163]|uniref:hypothetical protein n=1 Tax=Devosia sp. ZB163 TaxID=3025938 RepID=UPI00236032BC|nr:hypothetical protein [Devosia sp. ZB163]MDC9823761.1 hypothetical protein [Devosia sp. ZB163]
MSKVYELALVGALVGYIGSTVLIEYARLDPTTAGLTVGFVPSIVGLIVAGVVIHLQK